MTPQELNERIADLDVSMDEYDVNPEQVKQLIRDCIEAVTPERYVSPFDNSASEEAYNLALQHIQANTKELLG